MNQVAYELVFALIAIAGITAGYALYAANDGVPQAGGVVGHSLGVIGFLMMLSTETLYSLRKHVKGFTHGRMSLWLQAQIFTGLVGPYLVLLHSGGKFNGLAGVLTLLTGIVVLSGLIGRYIYTAVPRNLEGAELAVCELEEKIAAADVKLRELGVAGLAAAALTATGAAPRPGWYLVLARPILRWRQRRRLRKTMAQLDAVVPAQAAGLETLLLERQRLQMAIERWDVTRRMLALWHLFHIPLSAGLFTVAVLHIIGAMYYATFLR